MNRRSFISSLAATAALPVCGARAVLNPEWVASDIAEYVVEHPFHSGGVFHPKGSLTTCWKSEGNKWENCDFFNRMTGRRFRYDSGYVEVPKYLPA